MEKFKTSFFELIDFSNFTLIFSKILNVKRLRLLTFLENIHFHFFSLF
jgi:hypothetical protein